MHFPFNIARSRSVEAASGEWMNTFVRRPSRQRFNSKDGVEPGEIVARGIRRSWTFSSNESITSSWRRWQYVDTNETDKRNGNCPLASTDPSSSKEHQDAPGGGQMSPHHHQQPGGVQVYHHHPPQQHQMRKPQPSDAVGHDGGGGMMTNNLQQQHRSQGLLWEPRDPPLVHQYSFHHHHHHHQQQQQHPGGGNSGSTAAKPRLQPRRSASLSQADLVAYDGKILLNPSQSPRPQPLGADSGGVPSSAARYQDYYETKYEKPVRMSRADSQQQQSARLQSRGGVDVDAVWKSRWRSTSPPPAPIIDDWLPIKPPQLAWAKTPSGPVPMAIPVDPHHLPRRTKSTRIPSGSAGGPQLSRSMSQRSVVSSEMDHMIYLERDVPLMRERTRSIDRGLAGHPPAQQRPTYKTYEEELADYHGRTGSVDRLASRSNGGGLNNQQRASRPRTNIRMGTQVGRSVPVSLERRNSEVASSSTERAASSSSSRRGGKQQYPSDTVGDSSSSSNSLSGGPRIRRGSSSVEISSATDPSPIRSNKTNNNINRVYIDGQPDGPAAIRVTMTDTRSLKRPTGQNHPPASESSTMPRASSKRHGQVQLQPVRPTGIVQPQPHHHPGPTTVYLAAHDRGSSIDDVVGGGAVFRKVTPQRNGKGAPTDGKGDAAAHYPLYLFLHLSPIQHTIL